MAWRPARVGELLKAEISELLREEAKDPRLVGLFSITQVDVSPDLKNARVYVSVLGTDDEKAQLFEGLAHVAPFLQHELRGRLRLRTTPALDFRLDDRIEEGDRITRLLNEVAPPEPKRRRTRDA
jgi:ribosome-binding factor A